MINLELKRRGSDLKVIALQSQIREMMTVLLQ
jgi:hypothetical protein